MDTDDSLLQYFVDQPTLNHLKQGYVCIKREKFQEAKMCFENAINSNKKNIDAWLNAGMINSILNNKDEAVRSFENSFKCAFGKRQYTTQRFEILCDFYARCDLKLSDVKYDFELAKTNIDEKTPVQVMIRSFEDLKKRIRESTHVFEGPGEQPHYDPFFPEELVQDYPEHTFYSEGGNSRVYKCIRKKDDLTVAIKIPKEFDRKKSKDFIDEIAIWRDLDHKNIVKIVDYSANPAYIVMDYFPRTLSQSVIPMPTNDALKMILKVLDALSYAHKKGKIHTDIKRSNILLSKDDDPQLADWGLGRITGSFSSQHASQTSYTPYYAAPEQLRDEMPDTRTDIWQTGVVIYELVTGKNPFAAKDPGLTYTRILSEDPVELPSANNPNLKRLDGILMKCLEKKRDRRYGSADELARDIEEVLIEDFTTKTKNTSQYVRLTGYFELIRVYCQKNDYREVLAHLNKLRDLSQDDQIREMIDTKIQLVMVYRNIAKPLDDHVMDDLEKIFKEYLKKHIIETA
jgi:tRNA A-37 threonylcarbamoyl transferase component Bud32